MHTYIHECVGVHAYMYVYIYMYVCMYMCVCLERKVETLCNHSVFVRIQQTICYHGRKEGQKEGSEGIGICVAFSSFCHFVTRLGAQDRCDSAP